MKQFFDAFVAEYNDPETKHFFLISREWLAKWKRFTSYDDVIKGYIPDLRNFGQAHPGKINEDIIEENPTFIQYPDDKDYLNIFLKPNLQHKKDYELLTEKAWNYISKKYENIPIRRLIHVTSDGRKYVESSLKKIQIIPISRSFLKKMDHNKATDFRLLTFQAPAKTTLDELSDKIVSWSNLTSNKGWFESYVGEVTMLRKENINMWKFSSSLSLKGFFEKVNGICKRSTTYDYQIAFEGKYLGKDKSITLEDAKISLNDYLFIEGKEDERDWNFFGDEADIRGRCKICTEIKGLSVRCGCQEYFYCSKECRQNDTRPHGAGCRSFNTDTKVKTQESTIEDTPRIDILYLDELLFDYQTKNLEDPADEGNFLASHRKYYEEKPFADLLFKVEGKDIPAHMGFLVARCPNFFNMFINEMMRSANNVIEIHNMKAKTFNGKDFLFRFGQSNY